MTNMTEMHLCSTCNMSCARAGKSEQVRRLYGDKPNNCQQWTDSYKESVCPKCGGKLDKSKGNCYYMERCMASGCNYRYEVDSSD